MSKKEEYNKEYNVNRPKTKLKEIHKYYQDEEDSGQIFEDLSSTSKGTKMVNQAKDNKKVNFNENNQIFYNYKTNDNNDNIKKNLNYEKLNNIPEYKHIVKNNNNYINNNNEMIKSKNSKNKITNNSDYIGDNKIFTRIVPNFDNKSMEERENISSIPCQNYSVYDNKTYDANQKKNQSNSNFIYYKSKTPKKKCIYHKKKKNILNNNDASESSSIFSENNIFDNIISSSRNNDNDSKMLVDPKKLSIIIKNGLKKDLNSENDYIDLLTISDIKYIQKQNKLEQSYPQKNDPVQEKNNIINYNACPDIISTPKDTNNSEMSEESLYSNKQGVILFPKRNNYFLSKNFNNKKNLNRNNNKSYDCVVFKKKVGIIKKKKKKNKRNKTSDIYNDNNRNEKGTPIKKENIRGGIVVLYQNKFNKNNNKNLKSIKIKEKQNIPSSDNENNYIEEIKKVTISVTLIQKWWRTVHYKYIKKIILIQKIYRSFISRKKNQNLLRKKNRFDKITIIKNSIISDKNKIIDNINNINDIKNKNNISNEIINKKNKTNILYITKKHYIMPYNEIIIIQNIFREYLRIKNIKKNELKHYIKYIPKDICQITKKRFKNQNNDNIKIKKIKNTLDTIQSNKNTKHRYTQSKLYQTNINKILLSENEIKYETNNYTYLKKCNFRKCLNEDSENNDEEDLNRRAFTCEIMRKIRFNTNKRQLTPDANNRHNIIKNPNLKIIKLTETQYLRNNKKKNNKLNEKQNSSEIINNQDNSYKKNDYEKKNNINNDKNSNISTNQKEKSNINEIKSNRQNHFFNNNHNYKYSNIRENNGIYKNKENNKINKYNYNNNNKRNNNNKNNNKNDNYKIYYSYYNNNKK